MKMARIPADLIQGTVEPGFEAVRDEFKKNFSKRGEIGAACAIYQRGKKVVDLWGGYRDPKLRLPWQENTMTIVFSSTKGLASMAVAVAHSRGLFDYDERVAVYWPEFAQNGKEQVTVRQLLSHQAGICVIDEPLTAEILSDFDALAAIIARQKPVWEPGTKQGYHALSLGWYEGELIRRVDPGHRSLGQFFREEIAGPLGIEFYIGLPRSIPECRFAPMQFPSPWEMIFRVDKKSKPFFKAMMDRKTLAGRAFSNPAGFSPNDRSFLTLENPAYTGVGEARGIARAYSAFACGGGELGITPKTMRALTEPVVPPPGGLFDQMLRVEVSFSLGYMKPSPEMVFGSSDKAFGTPGAGGSFGFADPDTQVGFAYTPNKMGLYLAGDPRLIALHDTFYKCLNGN
ncbi:MAG: class A beta-lactamase-related serine hydrolase [Chloroflexota bacterium]|nr:MAG: class A beta-lactamase-related serine hydrolase [Chloroflexota bacterium]